VGTIKHDWAMGVNMAKKNIEVKPDWDLAGEMCMLSIEAYENSDIMNIDQYGFHLHKFIEDTDTDTQAIIAVSHEGKIAISFRGTSDFTDAFTDALAIKKPWIHGKGILFWKPRVHYGFLNAYMPVRNQILQTIKELTSQKPKEIHITGHSLGGALATLCAADIRKTLKLPVRMYNYGSPRVGNKKFKKLYNKLVPDTFRFVNDKDGVPTIPKIAYHHVGNLCYLDDDGEISINPSTAEQIFDAIQDMLGFMDFEALTDHLSNHYRDQLKPMTDKVKPLYGKTKDAIEDTIEGVADVVHDIGDKIGKYV
jgi:hypothetical protein